MKITVLVSTMFQKDYTILDRLNIQSDAVIVNQCDTDGTEVISYHGNQVLWVNSSERGLSRSRNMALKNAQGDICLICDDDEKLEEGYPGIIEAAFGELPDASVIAFDFRCIGDTSRQQEWVESPQKLMKNRTCYSVRMAFKLQDIRGHNITFNTEFGVGSGVYSAFEDGLFCISVHRAGLVIYKHPAMIGDVYFEQSGWFHGYDASFFYDAGAYMKAAFSNLSVVLKYYYVLKFTKMSELSPHEILKWCRYGIRYYGSGKSYQTVQGEISK